MVRGRAGTRAIYLGPRLQVAAASFFAVSLLGVGLTAFAAAWSHRLAEQLASEIEHVSTAARVEAERAAEDRELLSRLGRELSRSFAERDRVAAAAFVDGKTLAEQRVAINRLIDERKADMDHASAEREAAIARTISERNAAVAGVLADREAAMESEIAHRIHVAEERDKAIAARNEAISERDKALMERDRAANANRQLLAQLDAQTQSTIAQVESILAATGVDPSRLRKMPAKDAVVLRGGPFIPWNGGKDGDHKGDHKGDPKGKGPADEASLGEIHQIKGVASGLGKLQALRDLLERLPLAGPVAHVELANEFGFRIDPFTGLPARHDGVDLRGARNAPVFATAPGTVVYAGWQSEYGNLVEVDHGFGMTTRYAHLSTVLVKTGEAVALRQQVGLMGATGRATGVHLHYEVRVDGRARNPVNFLKAVRYVPEKVPTASDQFSGFSPR